MRTIAELAVKVLEDEERTQIAEHEAKGHKAKAPEGAKASPETGDENGETTQVHDRAD